MTDIDLSGLPLKAKVAMVFAVAGIILSLLGWLNSMDLTFKGMEPLDAVFGHSAHGKLYVGLPLLFLGALAFRLTGGKDYLEAQRKKN
ncbi:MAG: hypothetical protein MK135_11085 [Polyangiaceae bacterium]|nr:hypothetical protein [Polyangiaceae bacterium]